MSIPSVKQTKKPFLFGNQRRCDACGHPAACDGVELQRSVAAAGEIVVTRNFGEMSEHEFRKVLNVIKREYPDLAADEPIEFTGN